MIRNLKTRIGILYPLEIEVILDVLKKDLKVDTEGNGYFNLSGSADDEPIQPIIKFNIGDGAKDSNTSAVSLKTTYGRFICAFNTDNPAINPQKVLYTVIGNLSRMCMWDYTLAASYKQGLFKACEEAEEKAHEAFQKAKEAFNERTEQAREAIVEGLKTKREAQELLGVYTHVKDTFDRSRLPSIYNWKHQWADPNEDKLYFE